MQLLLLALGCHRPPPLAIPADGLGPWLERHRIPLTTLDPEAPLEELSPLGAVLGGRRVVALGEATHGTAEFFAVKHRLVRHLAEQHSFTIVAMEIPYDTGLRLDDWVHGGEGDLEELLRGTYFWLDAAEIAAMLSWMRAFAQQHPIELFGFDIQGEEASAQALAAHPGLPPETAELLAAAAEGELETVEDLEHAASVMAKLQLELAADPRALGHAAVVAQAIDLLRYCQRGANRGCITAGRDAFMADNVLRRLQETGGNAVVWAHNGHVAHLAQPDGWRAMGHVLREALGEPTALYSVALEFDHGRFTAPAGGVGATGWTRVLPELGGFTVAEYELGPAPPELLAHTLAGVSQAPWFLDLGAVEGQLEVNAFFAARHRLHEYGAFAPSAPLHTVEVPVLEAWDGLLFVPETTGAKPSP